MSITMMRPGHTVSRPPAGRKWLAVFALLSFFFQSLAIQTHIHQQPVQAATQGTWAPDPAKNPVKSQDPMDQCRLCQELVHAGSFVTPSAANVPAGLSFVATIFAALPQPADQPARAFAWQSRAPPRR